VNQRTDACCGSGEGRNEFALEVGPRLHIDFVLAQGTR
jgi:hypothetical protein